MPLSSTFYFYVSFLLSLLYQFSWWFLSVYYFPFKWGESCLGQHFSWELYWWGMATADSLNLGITLITLSYQKHCALSQDTMSLRFQWSPPTLRMSRRSPCSPFFFECPSYYFSPMIFKSVLLECNLYTLTFILSVKLHQFGKLCTVI